MINNIWLKMRYTLCVFVLSCFVCSGLQAKNKDSAKTSDDDITVTGKISDKFGME